ncbi:hypothetical protein [Flavobacterium sp. N2038]|uniref:hypothetical protein n=1 Tax=Flavobacterium sp. N2038 TaxID=2986829 RepID=UPI0022257939|nr:hypothetical protein [Flavobacterium sp. N2038]
MDKSNVIVKIVGVFLIVIASFFIFSDLYVLIAHWKSFWELDYLFATRRVFMFDAFRYFLLLIGGFGLLFKNFSGWIFSQTFLFLSLYYLLSNEMYNYWVYDHISISKAIGIVIVVLIIISIIVFLNKNTVKQYLNIYKYKRINLWSSILTLIIIGVLIHRL